MKDLPKSHLRQRELLEAAKKGNLTLIKSLIAEGARVDMMAEVAIEETRDPQQEIV